MAYRVDITARAIRNLRRLYKEINGADSEVARAWFNGLEAAIFSLDENPARSPLAPEGSSLRHLLYGKRHVYRIIYALDERSQVVTVIHIRHGARLPLGQSEKGAE